MSISQKCVEEYIITNKDVYSLGGFKKMLVALTKYGHEQFETDAWEFIAKKFVYQVKYYKEEGFIK